MGKVYLMVEKVVKVAISVPTESYIPSESYDNHLIHAQRTGAYEMMQMMENKLHEFDKKTKFHKIRYEFYWFTTGRLLTQMAREKLAEEAVKADCDYIIMFDSDMVLPPDFAVQMLNTATQNPKIDVLGALAFMRNAPHFPVIYNVIEGYDHKQGGEYYIREFVKRYPKDTLVECDAVGFGGVCIKVDLLKKMGAPWFMSTTNTGEDIWFCYQAKKKQNARIFMDTRIKLGHLKNPEMVDEEYFDKWVKDNKYDLGDETPNKYVGVNK